MSYDLYLFKKLEHKTVSECAREVLESEINSLTTEEFEHRKKVLTEKLKVLNPNFELFQNERMCTLTARESAIQINISPSNHIGITIPYWHTGEAAKKVFQELFQYLKVLKEETGYSIYDPQSGTEMNIEQGEKEFLKMYVDISENIESIIHNAPQKIYRKKLTDSLLGKIVIIFLAVQILFWIFRLISKIINFVLYE